MKYQVLGVIPVCSAGLHSHNPEAMREKQQAVESLYKGEQDDRVYKYPEPVQDGVRVYSNTV